MDWCISRGASSIDDLQAISRPEERVYRMRCVEAWSMVIPWAGIPFAVSWRLWNR